ncbi:MAG: hypothetical protein M3R55_04265 [Acidobacteriota bacterium]|nr:hypothetical protein [Acidobacteriota bacterium]
MSSRTGLVLVVVTGALVASAVTAASALANIGLAPTAFYGRTNRVGTLYRVAEIPVELIAAGWFAAIVAGLVAARRRSELDRVIFAAVFVSAIPLAGTGLWLSATRSFPTWPTIAITTGIMLALLISSAAIDGWPPFSETARVARHPSAQALVLSTAAVVALIGLGIRASAVAVPPDDALDRAFVRWFERPPYADAQLATPGGIRVVVFTDYQCPACATRHPQIEADVARLRESTPSAWNWSFATSPWNANAIRPSAPTSTPLPATRLPP